MTTNNQTLEKTTTTAPTREGDSAPSVVPPKKKSTARFFLELALLLPLCTFALESTLGFCGVGQQEIVTPSLELGCEHIPNKLVTWRLEGFSQEKFSSQGLRDVEHPLVKPAGTYRIALLGDSAVEGLQVRLDETYASTLQRLLNADKNKKYNYEVMNFGCSSYSTGQEYLQYKRDVAKYKPDLTIVMMCKGDTLENNIDVLHRDKAEPRPYFYLDGEGKLQEDMSIIAENRDKLDPNTPYNRVINWLRANSNVYGIITRTNFNLFLGDKAYYRIMRFQQTAGKKINDFVQEKLLHKKPEVTATIYAPQENRAVTKALVREFQKTVQESGSKFALMLFPDVTASDVDWATTVSQLKEQSTADNFTIIDLQPRFKQDKDPSSLFLQFHFSKRGHDLTAETILDLIKADKHE